MKTRLPLFLLLLTLVGYSQTSIEQFQSATGSKYAEVSGTIDQSTAGANVAWDFTGLTITSSILTDTYTVSGSNSTIETLDGSTVISRVGLNTSAGTLSVTSLLSEGIELNYTNNGIIGMFPLNFSDPSSSDSVAGTFNGGGLGGDVLNTSTINVTVDGWGNLKVGTFDGEVTRLKIVQNLKLSALGGFFTGTGTQTSYFYYDANSNDLIFRSSRVQESLTGSDTTLMEILTSYTLGNKSYEIAESDIKLINNPVRDVLAFTASDFIGIKAITISDMSGRVVLKAATNEKSINVNQLRSGLFLASITTDKGVVTKKFVKR